MDITPFPLLMTATVNPNGMRGLSVEKAEERATQYRQVLLFYLESGLFKHIVFAENSGYTLKEFEDLAKGYPYAEVEFLSCNLNDYPREKGKSYGEMRILDYVYDHSLTVKQAGGFFKVTGRFPILNLSKLIEEADVRQPWALFCDNKDHSIYDWLHLGWTGHACDTRFFGVTTEFYQRHFYGRCEELDDSQNRLIEFMFFETARQVAQGEQVIRRFWTEPEYTGLAGHVQRAILQVNDYSGWLAKGKRRIRQMGRKLVPFFWF